MGAKGSSLGGDCMDLGEFEKFWTTNKNNYALISVEEKYSIVNTKDKSFVLIEDDEIHNEVIRRMLENGNEVVTADWLLTL
jgi:hypothetical protein